MGIAEVVLLVAVLAVPLVAGALAARAGRPWWWAAVASVAVFLVAAVVPQPEEGESRVAAEDLVFLLVVALIVAGLTWLGAWGARRIRRT